VPLPRLMVRRFLASPPLSLGLEGERRIAHEDAATRLGQWTVHYETCDHMFGARHRADTHLHPLLGVDADAIMRWTLAAVKQR
jgi:hypothetical protein